MAIQFGVKEVLAEVGKYGFGIVTGTGITLLGLLAWTGADDLQDIKDSVNQFEQMAEQQVSAFVDNYTVTVDNANAEIKDYKEALEQANSNIDKLITAYNQAEQEHQKELEALEKSMVSVDEANEIIAKANEQIDTANQQVANTKDEVQVLIDGSNIANLSVEERLAETEKELDIAEEEPKATDIPSNIKIPTQEQPQE